MQLIPVIDLQAGQVVHAVRGERRSYRPLRSSTLVQGCEPVAVARALIGATGSEVLYVAELDAILHGRRQPEPLRHLLAALPQIVLWLDAGFEDAVAAQALLAQLDPSEAGRVRPVFGSESLRDRTALEQLRDFPDAILSLDRRGATPLDRAGCWDLPESWPATLIAMALDRVGSGLGPDLELIAGLRRRAPGARLVGAGGLRDAADRRAAAVAGAGAWLVASALHEGRLAGLEALAG
ncbi:HisA/HisF-related TIM barrel protein [Rivibacter subsaxonicus]|nr:HisA/HisF-related TIM barrel protein [Rivibacter subsaxonicus]